jgi:hypothetical protein
MTDDYKNYINTNSKTKGNIIKYFVDLLRKVKNGRKNSIESPYELKSVIGKVNMQFNG